MQHQQQKKITPSQVAKIWPKKGLNLQDFLIRPNVMQLDLNINGMQWLMTILAI